MVQGCIWLLGLYFELFPHNNKKNNINFQKALTCDAGKNIHKTIVVHSFYCLLMTAPNARRTFFLFFQCPRINIQAHNGLLIVLSWIGHLIQSIDFPNLTTFKYWRALGLEMNRVIITILIHIILDIEARPRQGVIQTGIKMWPKNPDAKAAKSSLTCPESHPFSFDAYTKCCSTRYAKFDPYSDPNFNGKELLSYHNEHSCIDDDFMPCGDPMRKCRTNTNYR